MEEGLKLVIGADFSELESGMQRAGQALSKFEQQVKRFGGGVLSFNKPVFDNLKIPDSVPASFKKTETAAQGLKGNLTGFTRVIQDLPYGFNAIANNLEQLVPAAGAAGLAFSGVIAALTFAQIGFGAWTRGMGGVSKSLEDQVNKAKEARNALDTYVESLGAVTQVNVKGAQAAQEELVKVQLLYKASQDLNVPLAERKKIVKELQDQYPTYFGNISQETILVGGAAKAYDKLKDAILATAKAEAGKQAIIDKEKEGLALDQKKVDLQAQLAKAKQDESKAIAKQRAQTFSRNSEDTGAARDATAATVHRLDIEKQIADVIKQRSKLREEENSIADEVEKTVVKDGAIALTGLPKPKKEKVIKEKSEFPFFDNVLGFNPEKQGLTPGEQTAILNAVRNYYKTTGESITALGDILKEPNKRIGAEAAQTYWKAFKDNFGIDKTFKIDRDSLKVADPLEGLKAPTIKLPITPVVEIANKLGSLKQAEARLQKFADDIRSTLQSSLAGAFEGIGQGLGDLLNGAGMDNAFKSIASIMGDFLQQLGKLMIQYAIQIKVFKEVFKNLISNPVVGIAAGIGLIAIGAAIKNAVLPKPKMFADGGIVNKATYGIFGEAGPEAVIPLKQLPELIAQGLQKMNFDLPGKQAASATATTQSLNSIATSQSLSINVGGEFKIKGDSLISIFAKTLRSQNRSTGGLNFGKLDSRYRGGMG